MTAAAPSAGLAAALGVAALAELVPLLAQRRARDRHALPALLARVRALERLDHPVADRHGIAESIRGRLERAGGSASVVSTPGEGTEVELRIPRSTS